MHFFSVFQLFLCLSTWALGAYSTEYRAQEKIVSDFFNKDGSSSNRAGSAQTNNWAVLVCSSRYWFNYQHMANALAMYRTVKRLGIPDSNIILMLADDSSCSIRDNSPGSVYANSSRHLDLYGDNVEVDYRGYEVTVENFIRVLTDHMEPSVPRSKRLLTNERSNIMVYMTGYGGNEFLKFQDNEEMSAFDIANAFQGMHQKKRYNEILFMIDTCQADAMHSKVYSPNIFAVGSSSLGENSYSHENDNNIGMGWVDTFTHYVLRGLFTGLLLILGSSANSALPPRVSPPQPKSTIIEEVARESHQLVSPPPPSSHSTVNAGLFTWLRKWRVVQTLVSVGLLVVLVSWVRR